MIHKLLIEKTANGDSLYTLDFPDLGGNQSMRFTLQLPQGQERTISQVEIAVMKQAQELLGDICSHYSSRIPKKD